MLPEWALVTLAGMVPCELALESYIATDRPHFLGNIALSWLASSVSHVSRLALVVYSSLDRHHRVCHNPHSLNRADGHGVVRDRLPCLVPVRIPVLRSQSLGKARQHFDLGLVLPDAPPPGHLIGVSHLEFPAVPGPRDEMLAALVRQQLQEELPQLDGPGLTNTSVARRIGTVGLSR